MPGRKRLPRSTSRAPSRAPLAWALCSLAALLYGVWAAASRAWWCDDAFISFRYAQNLNRGLGLVYNAGERVEGYSNFLWTMWTALGMRLGFSPEGWAAAWGVALYAATIALLAWHARREARRHQLAASLGLPLAALLAAAHADWNAFATSGLETAAFTFLGVLAYALATEGGAAWAAGLACALLALTRPDGLLFAPLIGAYLVWTRRPRLRASLAFAGAFFALWAPYVVWKLIYYGDFFPNTYYAKSAWLPWWSQGWTYLLLYARKYAVVLAGLPLALAALALAARDEGWSRRVALAAALAVAYTTYVVRVGGDFMYARLLIPATPFFLILLERGWARLTAGRPRWEAVTAAALVAVTLLVPYPFAGKDGPSGIANEPLFYPEDDLETQQRDGATLRRYFIGVPVSVVFGGSQARLVYYAEPRVAIESATGLTDRWIAHQPLSRRGRIGHEKPAPVSYLLERRVDFTLGYVPAEDLKLVDYVPWLRIRFDHVPGNIVHWNPAILDEMARRGAVFPNLPAYLDGYLAAFDSIPPQRLREDYVRFRRFYFAYAADSARERPFLRRLARYGIEADPEEGQVAAVERE